MRAMAEKVVVSVPHVMTEEVVVILSLKERMCRLPSDVLELILSKYLSLDDVGRMDVALLHETHRFRGLFLEALRSGTIRVSVERNTLWDKRLNEGVLNWILARGIRIVGWNNSHIDNERLTALMDGGLPNLQSLDITGSRQITAAGVIALANGNLPNLQSLDIGGYHSEITDAGVIALANGNLPNLQSLDISFCSEITDAGKEIAGRINRKE